MRLLEKLSSVCTAITHEILRIPAEICPVEFKLSVLEFNKSSVKIAFLKYTALPELVKTLKANLS